MTAAEIAHHIFPGVASFLVSDDDATLRIEHGQAARHGFIISETTIAMQFNPICKTAFDVIQSEWPLRMPRDLDALPGSEVAINLASRLAKLCRNCFDC